MAYAVALFFAAIAAVLWQQRRALLREKSELRAMILQQTVEAESARATAKRRAVLIEKLLPARVIDDTFVLDEPIGRGGYAHVYRGREMPSGEVVAVKVFSPQPGNDGPDALPRFRREITTGKQLKHPAIARVRAGGTSEDGKTHYLVMDLLEGRTLREEMRRGVLPVERACVIAEQVLRGLSAAHQVGVVHRDVKPDNVFLLADDRVKLLDFGVAAIQTASGTSAGTAITMTGQVVGTPGYHSPERLDLAPSDGRGDVYAVAVMMYEMLAGRQPFDTKPGDKLALMMAHIDKPPLPLRQLVPGAPEKLEALLLRCMSKDPGARPSAKDAADDLGPIAVPPRGR